MFKYTYLEIYLPWFKQTGFYTIQQDDSNSISHSNLTIRYELNEIEVIRFFSCKNILNFHFLLVLSSFVYYYLIIGHFLVDKAANNLLLDEEIDEQYNQIISSLDPENVLKR